MKLISLSDKEYSIQVNNYIVYENDMQKKSSLHIEARKILKSIYPMFIILEEVPAKINNNKTLYIDFYIPNANIAVEVNGEQHYKFSTMYHKSKADLVKAVANDNLKQSWCEKNNVKLITLPYNEQENWRQIIVNK